VYGYAGNIRVYCRVRPFLPGETNNQSTVDFVGEKGSIMIVNPNKQGKDQRKSFTFNKVFGPSAAQGNCIMFTTKQPQDLRPVA
jgi:kinesin family protein C2/C3